MKQAAIFDSDGTLIDSLPMHWRIERELLRNEGVDLTEEEQVSYTGKSERDWIRQLMRTKGASFAVDRFIEKMTERKLAAIPEVTFMPGVEELLDQLKAQGFKLAVATGASRAFFEQVRKRLALDRWFDSFVTADDVEKGKPSPEIFLASAKRLGVKAEECVVFEDGTLGLEAASAALMTPIAYRNKKGPAALRIEHFGVITVERLRSL